MKLTKEDLETKIETELEERFPTLYVLKDNAGDLVKSYWSDNYNEMRFNYTSEYENALKVDKRLANFLKEYAKEKKGIDFVVRKVEE